MSKIQDTLKDLQDKLNTLESNYEQANILLAMVNEIYTDGTTNKKMEGAYVYGRDLLDDKINKYFRNLGFK
jgi:hypothetical protein